MEKTVLHIKTDKNVKKEAQKVAADIGIPLSTVVNIYLKQFAQSKSISFSVAPKMTPALEKILGKVEDDIKKGKNMSPVFSSAKAANEYLAGL
jgi:addiction module RelB/DinJ family antitoxin